MSILVTFSPPSLTADQYDEIVARQYELGIFPDKGLDTQVCYGAGGQMKVAIVLDSMEAFQRLATGLMPIVAEMGLATGAPGIFEVHDIIRRGE
ncbi:MAG: hypothetical protein O2943_06970 [Actinomycetota bacterium]|nr:hypothetical protein [Actinomycetota bacterium]